MFSVETGPGPPARKAPRSTNTFLRTGLLCAAVTALVLTFILTTQELLAGGSPGPRPIVRPDLQPEDESGIFRVKPPLITQQCSDTCSAAKNGVCEDGSNADHAEGSRRVLCDLGTDCSDCGARTGQPVPTFMSQPGPIAYLLARKVDVRVRRTFTEPPMALAFTDPARDLDVSHLLERVGIVEGGITQVFFEVLKSRCVRPDGSRALVLDVGANFGYFAVYAALLGCRVMAWEPVPLFRAFIQYNLLLNNVSHLVQVRDRVVSDQDGNELQMMVPTVGIWGTASVAGINQIPNQEPSAIKVTSERLDSVVLEDAVLAKVDVEGYEPVVYRSLSALMTRVRVENLIMEYNPGTAERAYDRVDLLEDNPLMLADILLRGYRVMQLDDNYGKQGHIDYLSGIPPLPEVVIENLVYDLEDARRLKKWVLGKNKPAELAKLFPAGHWSELNYLPEDAHPKSFRSIYAMNTNVWAAHTSAEGRALMKSSGVVGVLSLDQDAAHEWFSKRDPDKGVASRVCYYLKPNALVRNRCNCSAAVNGEMAEGEAQLKACQEEEALVTQLVKEGKMGDWLYELDVQKEVQRIKQQLGYPE